MEPTPEISFRLMYITCPDPETAFAIGRQMVAEGRAACANVLPGLTSVYLWNNVLNEDTETVLLLKTTSEQVEGLIPRIRELHPYELPAIIVLEITGGLPDYLRWIAQSVKPLP